AGVVFRVRLEQGRAAARAVIRPGLERVVVLAGERRLRSLLAKDAVLLGRELGPPFGIGLLDLLHVPESTAGARPLRWPAMSTPPQQPAPRVRVIFAALMLVILLASLDQ